MLEEINSYFDNIYLSADFLDLTDKEYRYFAINKNFKIIDYEILKTVDFAIIGVLESRNSENIGSENSPDVIREELYKLFLPNNRVKIYDLGNLKQGKTLNDTYIALRDVIYELLCLNIIPIIIGGSQNLTYSQYLAHDKLQRNFNILTIDSCLDIGKTEDDFNSKSYIGKLIFDRSKYFKNYTNIGYQNYLVPLYEKSIIENLNFEAIRLGIARTNIYENEPYLRDADIFSIDISAVRQSSACGNKNTSPNGFLPEEVCQLAKYAGANDKTTSFGIYEVNSNLDVRNTTSQLAAQIVWHFIDGFYQRRNEYPKEDITKYKEFIIQLDTQEEIVFFNSIKSDKWWVKIKSLNQKEAIFACTYNDYINCLKSEIPERILKLFQNLY